MKIKHSGKTIISLIAVGMFLALWNPRWLDHEAGPALIDIIEARGSRALGARLDVSDAQIDPDNGEVTVKALVVANPGGFSDANMINVANIKARADLEARRIDVVRLTGINAVIEFRGAKSNFEELGKRAARRAADDDKADDPSGDEAEEQADAGGTEAGRRRDDWLVERIEFNGVRVEIRADWTSEVVEYQTDALLIEDLDASADDLVRIVIIRFLEDLLITAAAEAGNDRLREALLDNAEELRSRIKAPE